MSREGARGANPVTPGPAMPTQGSDPLSSPPSRPSSGNSAPPPASLSVRQAVPVLGPSSSRGAPIPPPFSTAPSSTKGERGGMLGSVPPSAQESLPRQFGKYTLMRKLAAGGMAELFLALHRSVAGFEKFVVIKRILPQM